MSDDGRIFGGDFFFKKLLGYLLVFGGNFLGYDLIVERQKKIFNDNE